MTLESEPTNEMTFNASQAADMSASTRIKYVLDTISSVGDYERYPYFISYHILSKT